MLYSYFHQTPLKVRAVTVQRGPIRSVVSTNGKIEPIQNFEAHAPIATTVKRLLVKEGDHVRKGQLLLQLDDADIRTQAARARAQVKTAQANQSALTNEGTQEEVLTLNTQLVKARSARDLAQHKLDALRRLQQDGAASPGEVRQSEEALQSAQADVTLLEQKQKARYSKPEAARIEAQAAEAQATYDAAEDALLRSSVHAPFDGVVYSLPVKQGAFVQAGDLLLQEADLSRVRVRAFVDEPDVGRRAWLPSRRSTELHNGARSTGRSIQVRAPGASMVCGSGRIYLCTGIVEGRWGFHQSCCPDRVKADPGIMAAPLGVAACGCVRESSSFLMEFTSVP